MNILELKCALDDAFTEINNYESNIRDKELVGLIDNDLVEGSPSNDKFRASNLTFTSIGRGQIPTGGSFILIECNKTQDENIPLEIFIKSLDRLMMEVPLNAPVFFQYEGSLIFLWCMCSTICNNEKTTFARLLFQFMDKNHPDFEKVYYTKMKDLGFLIGKR